MRPLRVLVVSDVSDVDNRLKVSNLHKALEKVESVPAPRPHSPKIITLLGNAKSS